MQNSTRDFRYTAIHNSTQFHTIPGMYIHIKWTNVGNDCRAGVIKTSALSQFPWSPRTPAGGFVRSMSASTYQAPFDAALGPKVRDSYGPLPCCVILLPFRQTDQQEMERTFCHLAALHGANQKSGFIHRLHSPTPTAIFSRHVVQNSLKYCRNVHPNCHTLPTASAVWMFCCADIQTTNKRRGMQQDLRCSIPSQLHALREQNKAHFRPRITMVPRTAAHMVRYTTLSGMSDERQGLLFGFNLRLNTAKTRTSNNSLGRIEGDCAWANAGAAFNFGFFIYFPCGDPWKFPSSCPRVATSPSMDWHISISDC